MPEDDDNNEDEDADEVYEFVTTGEKSCERCMALEGSQWDQPPNSPHPHCACEVQVRPKGARKPGQSCEDTTWNFEPISATTYGEPKSEGFEWGYRVTIDCWDGGSYDFEIWVDMGQLSDWPVTDTLELELEAHVISELDDDVEEVIGRVGRPCTPEVVS